VYTVLSLAHCFRNGLADNLKRERRTGEPENGAAMSGRLLPDNELSWSGLTGRSSTLRLFDPIADASGILERPVKPGDDD
jgi:hypothetical protein